MSLSTWEIWYICLYRRYTCLQIRYRRLSLYVSLCMSLAVCLSLQKMHVPPDDWIYLNTRPSTWETHVSRKETHVSRSETHVSISPYMYKNVYLIYVYTHAHLIYINMCIHRHVYVYLIYMYTLIYIDKCILYTYTRVSYIHTRHFTIRYQVCVQSWHQIRHTGHSMDTYVFT